MSASGLRVLGLSLMPYAGLLGIGRLFGTGAAVLAGAILVVAIDAQALLSVHIAPENSTAGLNRLAATLFDLSVVLPATFLLSWLIRPKI